jgi:hypothetical protein
LYTIEIVRFIGDHMSKIKAEVEREIVDVLLRSDIIQYKGFRIQVETVEFILEQNKIIFIGKEVLLPRK